MRLHEYQTKTLFERYGIPIVNGILAYSAAEAAEIVATRYQPAIINAQVLSDERVFRKAHSPAEAEQIATDLLNSTVGGLAVRHLLIEPWSPIQTEYALAIEFDRSQNAMILAAKPIGSAEFFREVIDPFLGVQIFQARYLASKLDLSSQYWNSFIDIALKLYQCFIGCDALSARILPLALTMPPQSRLIALGGRLHIDDNALYRQNEIQKLVTSPVLDSETSPGMEARIHTTNCLGDVACIANGTGLAMATADIINDLTNLCGIGSIIDIDGELTYQAIDKAFTLLHQSTRAIVINFFCTKDTGLHIADTILRIIAHHQITIPMIVRLGGANLDTAYQVLNAYSANDSDLLVTASTFDDMRHQLILKLTDSPS